MKRRVLWLGLVGCVAFLGGIAAWASIRETGASGSVPAPIAEGAHVDSAASVSTDEPAMPVTNRKVPKAVTDKTAYSFGTLEPGESCEHRFVIRNEGDAPLLLERGPTSCTCTMSHIPQKEIPPGCGVEVEVSSKVELEEGQFTNRARILTNDPDRPSIDFYVQGRVLTILAVDQPRVETYTLAGEAPKPQKVLIYSLAWKQFDIMDVEAALPDATWEVETADPETLELVGAKSGHFLTLKMPPQKKYGYHTLVVNVKAAPHDQPELEKSLHVEFAHRVKTGYSLSGDKLQWHNTTVEMGSSREGDGQIEALVLTVRDPQPLKVEKIEKNSPYLNVSLEPLEGGRQGVQSFRIELEVPPETPPCNFMTESAWVRIFTDNKAAKQVDFNVSFAVRPAF